MHIHDALIIGAGPCGLAIAARLREHTPSATFTDDEHQRYHWIRKHGRKMNIKDHRTKKDSLHSPTSTPCSSDSGPASPSHQKDGGIDMLVLDADGADWLTKWNRLFRTFSISHLRSPMFFHVDPVDRDALLGYAYEHQRESELEALPGCAGKEVSKHKKKKKRINARGRFMQATPDIDERDRKDYFTPSREVFGDHCEEVTRRYGLRREMVRQEKAVDIEHQYASVFEDAEGGISGGAKDEDGKIFRVITDEGIRYAHIVVLAVGPGNAPSIPECLGLSTASAHEGYCHAMQIKQFPPPHVLERINRKVPTHMLIIGGGLTSIQLADLALKRGVSKVWLLMRGGVKVKYFDVDLEWVGKFRNYNQATFWSADTDEERFEMLLQARNGGSMTPRYRKILDAHVASGKISLHTHTTLASVSWDATARTWTSITTSPPIPLPPIHYIVFATGVQSNIDSIPFLQTLQKQYPIPCIGGLPCLNDDLMWCDEVPLFVTGRLAGLRLGPGAPNLVGARVGAERIAWNVDDLLRKLGRSSERADTGALSEESEDEKLGAYASGRSNRFDSLVDISCQ